MKDESAVVPLESHGSTLLSQQPGLFFPQGVIVMEAAVISAVLALSFAYSRAFCRGKPRWQAAPLSVSPVVPKQRDTGSPSQAPTRRMPVRNEP